MRIQTVKTRKLLPPKDNLWGVLKESIKSLEENSVVAIASKIVSIGEGRCIDVSKVKNKDELIKREAEFYLPRSQTPKNWVMHTLKQGFFMPSAGIDVSGNYYILWPKNPEGSAHQIWKFLRKTFMVDNLGVVITDSHTVPLRRGVVGISLGYWGFMSLRNYRQESDLFGGPLRMSQINIPDSLAACTVFAMGEGSEQTPIAIIKDIPHIKFIQRKPTIKSRYSSFFIPLDEDIYAPFLKSVPWEKGGS